MKISELLVNMILNEMEGSISLPPPPPQKTVAIGGIRNRIFK